MIYRLIHSFVFLLICLSSYGQGPKFYVNTDARKIVEGSYLQVKFILEQAQGSNFKPPRFEGFDVVSGPSSSSSTSIVNGVVSREYSYGYGLLPKSIGTKTIPPASITVNGRTLKTQAITIEVVKGSNKAINTEEQVFIRTEVTDTSTYVGQQIIVNYKMYTTVDVRSVNFVSAQELDGFYAEELRITRKNYSREIINGVEYFTKPIKKIALFPQQTGTYTIKPENIRVGIATQGSSRSIFFNSQLLQKNLRANGATIYVNSLPSASQNFSGAVGRYSMVVSAGKRSITTDEAITVKMQITGNGDSKTVNPPKWPLPEGLEMYDPNVIEDEVFRSADGLTHRKTFEYLIVAKAPGRYNLTPSFEYFNVDSSNYRTLTKALSRITVVKGSNNPTVIADNEQLKLAGIFETTKLSKISNNQSASVLPLLFLLAALLGVLAIFLYSNYLKKSGKLDPELIKRNKAYKVALSRLEGSKTHMDKGDAKAFHEEMIVALKTYVTDKFNIPALHINRADLITQLKDGKLSEAALETFDKVLQESELAMYAPGASSDLQKTYDTALEMIAALETGGN